MILSQSQSPKTVQATPLRSVLDLLGRGDTEVVGIDLLSDSSSGGVSPRARSHPSQGYGGLGARATLEHTSD
jgi:hypothetical protein